MPTNWLYGAFLESCGHSTFVSRSAPDARASSTIAFYAGNIYVIVYVNFE